METVFLILSQAPATRDQREGSWTPFALVDDEEALGHLDPGGYVIYEGQRTSAADPPTSFELKTPIKVEPAERPAPVMRTTTVEELKRAITPPDD